MAQVWIPPAYDSVYNPNKGYIGFNNGYYQNTPVGQTGEAVNAYTAFNGNPQQGMVVGATTNTGTIGIGNGAPVTNGVSTGTATTTTTNSPSMWGYGTNAEGQTTYAGGTGMQWAGLGLNTAFGLFNAYQSYQANKLAKAQFEDQQRLNHANYQMQAKSYNNSLRNQQSGRSYVGMSSSAKQTLGKEYQTRKANEDY